MRLTRKRRQSLGAVLAGAWRSSVRCRGSRTGEHRSGKPVGRQSSMRRGQPLARAEGGHGLRRSGRAASDAGLKDDRLASGLRRVAQLSHHRGVRLLILGGTWFLGRTIAEQAIAAGWQVTTFSRGRSGRDVPGAVPVRGQREDPDDVARLAGSDCWDVVVDTSGYTPEAVDLAARMLRDRTPRYVLISTVNAYRGWPTEPLTDESRVYEDSGDGARPCLLYTSPSPRDRQKSRMPSSA